MNSIRGRLLQLILVTALPPMILAAIIAWVSYRDQRATIELHLVETTRALSTSLDNTLGEGRALLAGLATSRSLEKGDLVDFYEQAKAALTDDQHWVTVNAVPSGKQLLNTRIQPGNALPSFSEESNHAWIRDVVAARQPVVREVSPSLAAAGWTITVQFPVIRDGELRQVLNLNINTTIIERELTAQRLPESWTASLLDKAGKHIARNRSFNETVGRPASATLIELIHQKPEGFGRTFSIEGDQLITAWSRSPDWDWTVAIGIPEAAIVASIYHAIFWIIGAGLAGTLIAALLAGAFARRIAEPVRRLANAAERLGAEAPVALPSTGVSELDAVGAALTQSADRVQKRTEERDRNEAALTELAATLERRVVERTAELESANEQLQQEMKERRDAEDRLLHAQKMEAIGRLTGGVAHDFNNLLAAIIGNLELASLSVDGEKPRRLIDGALKAADRGAKLNQQLLAFTRKEHEELQSIDIARHLHDMSDMLTRTMGGLVSVRIAAEPKLWSARVDSNQLELAVLNLAINARDAMLLGGRLTVEARNNDAAALGHPAELASIDCVCISVIDSGPGMPEDVRARAFEPFFTTKEIGKGSGLGLAQVYGFARNAGGLAAIETSPSGGTAVRLYLPRSELPLAIQPDTTPIASSESTLSRTVLVVDDDEAVREIVVMGLEEAGCRIIEAGSGLDALALLPQHKVIDLAIVDYAMPGLNGAELIQRLQAARPELPILCMTGYAEQGDLLRHITAEQIIAKPFKLAELVARVRQFSSSATSAKIVPLRGGPFSR